VRVRTSSFGECSLVRRPRQCPGRGWEWRLSASLGEARLEVVPGPRDRIMAYRRKGEWLPIETGEDFDDFALAAAEEPVRRGPGR
jgi:hypothetical protein